MRVALLDPPSFTAPYDDALATALARRGHDVSLLTSPFAHGEAPSPDGYRREELFLPVSSRLLRSSPRSRLRLPLKGLEYGPSVVRLLRRVQRLEPDVAHVQWLAIPRLDVHWLRRLDRPTVLTAHDVLPRRPSNARAWGEVLALVDRVIVQSQRALEQLAGVGVERERLVRIQHPVFESGVEASPPEGRTILFFGLIRDYKGLDVLLRALADVPQARLVVAGDPLDSVKPVQRLAQELGVADRIDWRLGYLPEKEVETLMREATMVVFPHRGGEFASGTLATALGHGRPVVVTEILGETVREYGAGLVVPPDDPAALAEACTRLLTDKAALSEAFHGTEWARAALSWAAIAEAHERLYADLVGKVAAE